MIVQADTYNYLKIPIWIRKPTLNSIWTQILIFVTYLDNVNLDSDPDPGTLTDQGPIGSGSTTLDLFGYLWLELVQD